MYEKNSIPIARSSVHSKNECMPEEELSWKFMRFWWSLLIVAGLVVGE